MPSIGFFSRRVHMTADGAALTNSTTPTSLLHASGLIDIDANWWAIGKKLALRASGRISNTTPVAGNLTLDVRMGGTVVFNGQAIAQDAANIKTNLPWNLSIELTCRAIGAAGNFFGTGIFSAFASQPALAAGTTGAYTVALPCNTAPAVGNNVNTTTTLALDLFATWSALSASLSIQCHTYEVELLNV